MLASEAIRRASKVGGRVSLHDVRLHRLQAERDGDIPQEGSWDVDVDIEAGHGMDGRRLLVEVRYTVRATVAGADDARRGFRIATSWRLDYEVASVDDLDSDDCASFARVSGVFAAHPYQREIVHRLSAQMGFDALVLNVLQSPTDLRAGADFELPPDDAAPDRGRID